METQSNTHRLCQSSLFVITATVTVIISLIVIITATDSFHFRQGKSFCHETDAKCHLPRYHHQTRPERFKGSGKVDQVAEVKLLHRVAPGTQKKKQIRATSDNRTWLESYVPVKYMILDLACSSCSLLGCLELGGRLDSRLTCGWLSKLWSLFGSLL